MKLKRPALTPFWILSRNARRQNVISVFHLTTLSKVFLSSMFIYFVLTSPCMYAEDPSCKIVLGFKCMVKPLYGNTEIESFVKKEVKSRRDVSDDELYYMNSDVRNIVYPDYIYIEDLNKDNIPEYIVPVQCGATGNCTYLIFGDHPARLIGEINGQYIIFEPGNISWPKITTYGNSGAMCGGTSVYLYSEGKYKIDLDLGLDLLDGIDHSGKYINTLSPFLKQLGPIKCECKKPENQY